jgi:hypothetical protein
MVRSRKIAEVSKNLQELEMLDILKEKVHVLRDGMEHNEVKESEF